MGNWLEEIDLLGTSVRLSPLKMEHAEALVEAAADGELWNLWYTSIPSSDNVQSYIADALEGQANGTMLPFVVIDSSDDRIIGTTRYLNVEADKRRLEIGYTWYAKRAQRSPVNTECKYLLLGHAFETLDCIAVEFRTHWHNHASRNAIARLGAKQDGVLRNHLIDGDGCYRDTVVFSIIDHEWKTVKRSLQYKMSRNYE